MKDLFSLMGILYLEAGCGAVKFGVEAISCGWRWRAAMPFRF
jgi:hypothetical protein